MDKATIVGLRERIHSGRPPYKVRFYKKCRLNMPCGTQGAAQKERSDVYPFFPFALPLPFRFPLANEAKTPEKHSTAKMMNPACALRRK